MACGIESNEAQLEKLSELKLNELETNEPETGELSKLALNQYGFSNIIYLASGFFGYVFSADVTRNTTTVLRAQTNIVWERFDAPQVAVKVVAKCNKSYNETKFLKLVKHANIVKFYGSFVEKRLGLEDTFIVMERLGPSIDGWMEQFNVGPLTEEEIEHIFCNIGPALIYLHETLQIVHFDLNLGNMVSTCIDGFDTRNRLLQFAMKLIDFGVSMQFRDKDYQEACRISKLTMQQPKITIMAKTNYFLDEALSFAGRLVELSLNKSSFGSIQSIRTHYDCFREEIYFQNATLKKVVLLMHLDLTIKDAYEMLFDCKCL